MTETPQLPDSAVEAAAKNLARVAREAAQAQFSNGYVRTDWALSDVRHAYRRRARRLLSALEPHIIAAYEEQLRKFADELEAQNLEGDGPSDLTAATVRAVKAQGIRDAIDWADLHSEGGKQ